MARFEEYEIAPTTGGRILEIYTIWGRSLGNCVFVINLAPDLGKPAFLILTRDNMRVPWPGDCAKNSKLKNVGFSLSPHFRIVYILIGAIPRWGLLYLYSRYTAMAAYDVMQCMTIATLLEVPGWLLCPSRCSGRRPWSLQPIKRGRTYHIPSHWLIGVRAFYINCGGKMW